jgi:hypothetical protein
MVIETRLSKDQFIRISVLRHFQRPVFFINAFACAIATVYAIFQGPWYIFLVGWAPFMIYIVLGFLTAIREGNQPDHPYQFKTRYEFSSKGIHVSTEAGSNLLEWRRFVSWSMMAGCYVLTLSAGSILAIPQDDIPPHNQNRLEQLLIAYIGKHGQFRSRPSM